MTRWDGGTNVAPDAPPPPKFQGSRAFIDEATTSSSTRSTAIKAGLIIVAIVSLVSFALGYLLALALT